MTQADTHQHQDPKSQHAAHDVSPPQPAQGELKLKQPVYLARVEMGLYANRPENVLLEWARLNGHLDDMMNYAVDVTQDNGTGLQYGQIREKTAEEKAAIPKPQPPKPSDDAMETGKPLPPHPSQPGSSQPTAQHADDKKGAQQHK